jgi:hypothetical protein
MLLSYHMLLGTAKPSARRRQPPRPLHLEAKPCEAPWSNQGLAYQKVIQGIDMIQSDRQYPETVRRLLFLEESVQRLGKRQLAELGNL